MSEYQYYEFQAIDRTLTREKQAELRACSSRARISATHFVNEYHWGNLKGDPMEWMEKYFDAHVYLSNFGSRSLVFRFPLAWIDPEMIWPYEVEGALEIQKSGSHLILSLMLDTEPGEHDDEDDVTGILSSLVAIRAALASGDTRALYLGWLSAVQYGLVDGGSEEPPVPHGLNAADNALECLAGFLHVSDDLLKAAAKLSIGDVLKPAASDVAAWLAALGPAEKDRWLSKILQEDDSSAVREIRRLFLASSRPPEKTPRFARSVDELLAAAEDIERQRLDEERKDADEARQQYLRSLIGRESELWKSVIKLSESSSERYQDSSVRILTDLRDLAGLIDATGAFQEKLEGLIELRRRKSSYMRRLEQAGFL